MTIYDLSNRKLTKIPDDMPIETTILYLNNNQITKLQSLDKLVNLRILYLQNNKVRYSLNKYHTYNIKLDHNILFFETEKEIKDYIFNEIKEIQRILHEKYIVNNIIEFIY